MVSAWDNRNIAFVLQKDNSSNNVRDKLEKKNLVGRKYRQSEVSSSSDGKEGEDLEGHFRSRSIGNGK